jgi:hypothetical protein
MHKYVFIQTTKFTVRFILAVIFQTTRNYLDLNSRYKDTLYALTRLTQF